MCIKFDAPTVEIQFEYAREDGRGGWAWVPALCCRDTPPPQEHVYTAQEMCHAIKAYGPVVAGLVQPGEYTRWRLVARGLCTGLARAEYVWEWDAERERYRPQGSPWITWPTRAEDMSPGLREVAARLGYTGLEPRCKTCKSL